MNYFGDTVQDGANLKIKNLAKYICYGGLRSRYGFMFLVSPSIFRMCSNYAAYVIWRSMKPLLESFARSNSVFGASELRKKVELEKSGVS